MSGMATALPTMMQSSTAKPKKPSRKVAEMKNKI